MVQRLPGRLHAVVMEPGSHGLDAFALARLQQALAVVFQRLVTIGMPGGVGPAVQPGRQAFFCGLGPEDWDARNSFIRKCPVYDPVVLNLQGFGHRDSISLGEISSM
jgi:hypothetical protein